MTHFLLIAGAALVAGAMNALAGGGSFVTLPALIAVGLPSVQANASSTVALYSGVAVSAWTYRGSLGPVGAVPLRALLPPTLIGGAAGAVLLLCTPSARFDQVLPWLLLLAVLALAGGRRLSEWLQRRVRIGAAAVIATQFLLGIYAGYFGGAVGIMMMALWSLLGVHDMQRLHAARTVLVIAANTMAVVIFSAAGIVRWPETLVMLASAVAGGYLGARLGRVAPAGPIRAGTLLLTALITAAFFVRAYGGAG